MTNTHTEEWDEARFIWVWEKGSYRETRKFILSLLAEKDRKTERDVMGCLKEMRKKNDTVKCLHRTPRTADANNYDCTDIHIGVNECLSDIEKRLTNYFKGK